MAIRHGHIVLLSSVGGRCDEFCPSTSGTRSGQPVVMPGGARGGADEAAYLNPRGRF